MGVPDVDVQLVPWNAVTKSAVMVRSHAVRAAATRRGGKRSLRRAGVELSSACVRTDRVHRQAVLLNRVNPGLMHVRNVRSHPHLRARGLSWQAGTLAASWNPLPLREASNSIIPIVLDPCCILCCGAFSSLFAVLGDRPPALCCPIGTAACRFGALHVLLGLSGILRSQSQTEDRSKKRALCCSGSLQRSFASRVLP